MVHLDFYYILWHLRNISYISHFRLTISLTHLAKQLLRFEMADSYHHLDTSHLPEYRTSRDCCILSWLFLQPSPMWFIWKRMKWKYFFKLLCQLMQVEKIFCRYIRQRKYELLLDLGNCTVKKKMPLYARSPWIAAYEYHSNAVLSKAILTSLFFCSRSYLRAKWDLHNGLEYRSSEFRLNSKTSGSF